MALPDEPPAVVEAASSLWTTAFEGATALANAALDVERAQIETARDDLMHTRETMDSANAAAFDASQRASAALVLVEARCNDLQRLTDQQTNQLADLMAQRDALVEERLSMTEHLRDITAQRDHQAAEAFAERQALEAQYRATEDRWLREVDLARQEAAHLRARIARMEKESGSAERRASERMAAAATALRTAEGKVIAHAARLSALESEIERWHLHDPKERISKVTSRGKSRISSTAKKLPLKPTPRRRKIKDA